MKTRMSLEEYLDRAGMAGTQLFMLDSRASDVWDSQWTITISSPDAGEISFEVSGNLLETREARLPGDVEDEA